MENSQTAKFSHDLVSEQSLVQELTGDYLWKSLYSHSYTLFFNCATCSYQFDIDGWFYQFESIVCPQCHTEYNGVFGKTLPGTVIDLDRPQRNVLKLESFDGQEIDVHISSNNSLSKIQLDHLLLVIFAKPCEKGLRPWCAIDWSDKNAKAIYLQPVVNANPVKKVKAPEKKPGILVPIILVGLLFVIGLVGLYLFL
jgi:hypothetical protein